MIKKCETLSSCIEIDRANVLLPFLNRSNANHDVVRQHRDLLLLLLLLIFFQSCNQPTQGCRDINATNYDVTADENCEDDCCQLPELKIQFSHKIEQRVGDVDTVVNFKYNTSYILPISLTDTFSFQKIKCYFSDFRLIDMDGGEVQVNDRLTIDLEGDDPDSITIVDDVLLFDAGSTNYTLGEFDQPNTFEGLKFTVGLQSELFTTNPEIAPANSAFTPDSINYEVDFGYIPQKYVFFSEPSLVDSISTIFRVFDPVEIELSTDPFALVTGFDGTLRMTVRYDQLFENIVLGTDVVNITDFRENIVINLPNAITLDSLDQN
jgi:hypothetical protein